MSTSSPAQSSAAARSRTQSVGSDASRSAGTKSVFRANTKITGVLKDLEDDIVSSAVALHMGSEHNSTDKNSHLSGTESVYVEHNGRFTKAPKQLLNDYHQKEKYFEDKFKVDSSPLDTAIWMQKTWSKIAKLCLGFLGGIALIELVIVVQLMPSNLMTRQRFFEVYPFMDTTLSCLMLVYLTLSLVVLCDWIDLGHFQMIHVGDSFSFKKIILIIVFLFAAFVLLLCNRPMDDSFYLHESLNSNFSYDLVKEDVQNLKHVMINWEFLCIWKDCLIILAWILLILSKNEDLFLLHLLAMKKYDYRPDTVVHQNGFA
ncbi:Hypothetical protein NTJ_14764 [Nesidiocoris tenuis]|uniref:Uncharacterized protein n=1 Tax=Nesidiocoris tenuis TaxID=355587 RepID=A0ABN7BC44_9HEMI|nr:Hypothetical protein NTJ_14764 [Nesidiocoris tenuis]